MATKADIQNTANKLTKQILSLRNKNGTWDGYLSSSALAVAVGTYALWEFNANKNKPLIDKGAKWLVLNQNTDGGYGDTPESKSNLSTSLLCWSFFSIKTKDATYSITIEKLEHYIKTQTESLEPEILSKKILAHYASDRTFSVPILAMCAITGRLGKNGWKFVPQLPYQFAILPSKVFRWINLTVVSYALPALVSMGIVKQKMTPSKNWALRLFNKKIEPKLLRILSAKQPPNGGFLEAIPLTGFVLMTLIKSGYGHHKVSQHAAEFLIQSFRDNGSMPIDTNLTTWVSSLAVNAMGNSIAKHLTATEQEKLAYWFLNQQHKTIHPFTQTAPGGWSWIDKPGGVADGDDTSGALLALHNLNGQNTQTKNAALKGLNWLMGIQNNDGGFPTFCKGWTKLPFDASCPDITAHAVRAILTWQNSFDDSFNRKLQHALKKALSYLIKVQHNTGYWLPLWFGNENDKQHENPVYGTSLVVLGLIQAKTSGINNLNNVIKKGIEFIMTCKNENGSWGGNKNLPGTIEESGLAIKAIVASGLIPKNQIDDSINWLISTLNNDEIKPTPIGFYFASLWYHEKMYPYVYALGALNQLQDSHYL